MGEGLRKFDLVTGGDGKEVDCSVGPVECDCDGLSREGEFAANKNFLLLFKQNAV